MNKKIAEQLCKDSVLCKLVKNIELSPIHANYDIFQSLINSIISQQISLKAAESIYLRLIKLFRNDFEMPKSGHWNMSLGDPGKIHPDEILNLGEEEIKKAGLTKMKAKYIINVAQYAKNPGLEYEKLDRLNDYELLDYLTEIKGVGEWTAHMIMMFSMGREDVFPIEDLTIRYAIIKLYSLKDPNPPKNPSNHSRELRKQIIEISNKWKPYRSYACFYLWQYLETMESRTI